MMQTTSLTLSAMFSISAAITSDALSNGSQWPLVTVPQFEFRTTGLIETTGTPQVVFAPLVNGALRTEFETYAVQQQQPTCNYQGCVVAQKIYNGNGSAIAPTDLLSPIWEAAPGYYDGNSSRLLLNQFSDPIQAGALNTMLAYKAAVFSNYYVPKQSGKGG